MGNSPLNGGLINNGNQACKVKVREASATLFYHGKKVEKSNNGKITEIWELTYKIGNSTCGFRLSKTTNPKRPHGEALYILISDNFNSGFWRRKLTVTSLRRDEVGLFYQTHLDETQSCHAINWSTFTTNADAEITETSFNSFLDEGTNRRGITITEWKKKNKYNKPYMGNVTHYFISLSHGQEVILSIAIKRIRVRNGQFDFLVDGPKQHPLHELDDISKQLAATMRNTHYYPHNNFVWQSSESESDADNVDDTVPSSHHGHGRNAGGLISNDGMYYGNYNGSTFIKNLIVGLQNMFM